MTSKSPGGSHGLVAAARIAALGRARGPWRKGSGRGGRSRRASPRTARLR
jgi:hypothetical protein